MNILDLPEDFLLQVVEVLEGRDILRLLASCCRFRHLILGDMKKTRKFNDLQVWILFPGERFFHFHNREETNKNWPRKCKLEPPREVLEVTPEQDLKIGGQEVNFARISQENELVTVVFLPDAADSWIPVADLFRHIFAFFGPSSLSTNLPTNRLFVVKNDLPKTLRRIVYQQMEGEIYVEKDLLGTLREQSLIESLHLEVLSQVSPVFYNEHFIRGLKRLVLNVAEGVPERVLTDSALLNSRWKTALFGPTDLSVYAVRQFLIDWAEGRREIEHCDFHFERTTYDEVVAGLPVEFRDASLHMGASRVQLVRSSDRKFVYFYFLGSTLSGLGSRIVVMSSERWWAWQAERGWNLPMLRG